jgi:hypothetical protein
LALNKLKNNADVALLQGGKVLAQSRKGGKKPEAIASTLEAGTYFIKVSQKSGNSKYRLALNASPLSENPPGTNPPGTNPPGTNPPGTNLPTSGSRFLSYNYGIGKFDPVVGKLSIVYKLDLSSTETFTDIAALGTDVYATTENNLYKIDFNTGTPSLVGSLSGAKIYALAFAPSGQLYGVGDTSSDSYSLFSIDRATGNTTPIYTDNSVSARRVLDMVYEPTSGRFLVTSNGAGSASISLTGDIQSVFFTLGGGYNGLAFENGKLYGYNFGRSQEEIDASGGTQITSIKGTSKFLELDPVIPETFGSLTGAG